MKWVFAITFLIWPASAFSQIKKILLEEYVWKIHFPCIRDSSVFFSDSIIISNQFSDTLICRFDSPAFKKSVLIFTDSTRLVLMHSGTEETIEPIDKSPPYYTTTTVTRGLINTDCTWKVMKNNLFIKPDNFESTFIYTVILLQDKVILYKRE